MQGGKWYVNLTITKPYAHKYVVAQLALEKYAKKNRHDAQGSLSLCLKKLDAGEARANVLQTAQEDIDQGGLAHTEPTFPAQEGLQNLGVAVSENDDVLQSLGTVLEKVKVIADATANAVDGLAKVSASFQPLIRI